MFSQEHESNHGGMLFRGYRPLGCHILTAPFPTRLDTSSSHSYLIRLGRYRNLDQQRIWFRFLTPPGKREKAHGQKQAGHLPQQLATLVLKWQN